MLSCCPPLGHFLRAAGLVPASQAFKAVVVGIGRKGAARVYAPTLVTGARALGKVLFLDCRLPWNMPEETPKACVPSRLPSLPHALGTSQFLQHHSAGCCHHGRGDPEEGSCRRAPRGLPDALPAGPPRPLGAAGVVSVQEDPPGSGGCEPGQRGAGPQAHGAGLIGWHHLPTPLSPNSPPTDPGCSGFRHVAAAQVTKA